MVFSQGFLAEDFPMVYEIVKIQSIEDIRLAPNKEVYQHICILVLDLSFFQDYKDSYNHQNKQIKLKKNKNKKAYVRPARRTAQAKFSGIIYLQSLGNMCLLK